MRFDGRLTEFEVIGIARLDPTHVYLATESATTYPVILNIQSAEGRFWGGTRKKGLAFFAGASFWEEPEKQRPDVPQDAGRTPSACLSQMGSTSEQDKRPQI